MKIGIGIDTGGTYTDAVIYEFETKAILGTSKALTTKQDLSVGILEALDLLPAEPLKSAEVISLSTTLATNACVEDKGGIAKLIFLGGDSKIIDKYGGDYGLPKSNEMYIQESYTTFSGEIEREPDWDLFCSGISDESGFSEFSGFNGLDGAGIIEINAIKNSAVVEKKAKELFLEKYDIPVVCGHELFNELNCLRRASSTLLNARLFPVIREFMQAIKTAMKKRGINASVVIVRSDGSLMSEEFARRRPVETLLCGPAASVMGSAQLTEEAKSIVVDMGGTTTDIALIKDGVPYKATGGISIGRWKTFVDGLYIKTFGLGGDTAVHYNCAEKKIFLEDYRVVPLCAAAEKYPYIINNLKKLIETDRAHTKYLHEHYMIIKDISDNPRYTAEEKKLCAELKKGPLPISEAAEVVDKDVYSLDIKRLIKEGIVQICGLTPTDIMHIRGDFNKFPVEAAVLAARYAALNLNISVDELCDCVYDEIKRKLYMNIVEVMLENKDGYYMKNGFNKDIDRFINESYDTAKTGLKHEFLSVTFSTDFTLTGVGAPIRIFLEDVAKMLGTTAVIPEHYEVANALGAIVGNIYASNTVEIKPVHTAAGITGYTVFGNTETKVFKDIRQAEEFALSDAKNSAHDEAVRRGVQGEITVSCRLSKDEAKAKDNMLVYLGTYAIADAVGSIGF